MTTLQVNAELYRNLALIAQDESMYDKVVKYVRRLAKQMTEDPTCMSKEEYFAMLDWAIEQDKYPVAVRIPCNGVIHSDKPADTDYSSLDKYKITQQGEKIAILALGDFYQIGEALAKRITETTGTAPTLINPRYITGTDNELLGQLKEQHLVVVTLEDGILNGGFGEKIARFYGASDMKVYNYGLKKEFLDRYSVEEVLKENHLTPEQICEDILA